MDNRVLQRMTAERAKKRFGSHDVLYSKYAPQIPASAEREYVRTTNAYMRILKEELEKELPKLKAGYKVNRDAEMQENRRSDGAADLMLAVAQVFNTIKNAMVARMAGFGLRRKLEALANLNRKLSVREWQRAIKTTLGIDIREDYYKGDFYADQLEKWIDENVALIKSIPENTLDKMRDIVYNGFTSGITTTRMVKDIRMVYGVSRKKAELIARDQTAKLSGQIQRAQQQDAGVTEYIWNSCGDERVRKGHRKLNGKKFSWDDPPVVDEKTKRRCHPGQDFQCRCIGRPVFDRNTLCLPLADDGSAVYSYNSGSGNRYDPKAKDRFGILTNNNKGDPRYYELEGKDLKTVESELSQRTYETAVCFDENGKAIFAQLGDEDTIRFTKAQRRQMRGKVVTHNHPLNTPPSPEDLYVLKENGLKEFRTCGMNGTYVLRYSKQIEELPEFDEISSLYNKLLEQKIPLYQAKTEKGMEPEEALKKIGEEIWREINRQYGIKLEYERR